MWTYLATQPWETWRLKDTHKGPLFWHVEHVGIHITDEQGLPAGGYHLLAGRHALRGEVKYFVGYAPGQTLVKDLLRVTIGRWRIERCFLEGKGEGGLHDWEGQRCLGLKRHLMRTVVSYQFLTKACQRPQENIRRGRCPRCASPPMT